MARLTPSAQERLKDLNKSWDYSHKGIVNNGFPVVIWFNVDMADPTVGYLHDSIDEYEITTLNGYPTDCWLKISEDQINDLITEAHEALIKEAKANFYEPDCD